MCTYTSFLTWFPRTITSEAYICAGGSEMCIIDNDGDMYEAGVMSSYTVLEKKWKQESIYNTHKNLAI